MMMIFTDNMGGAESSTVVDGGSALAMSEGDDWGFRSFCECGVILGVPRNFARKISRNGAVSARVTEWAAAGGEW